MNDHANPNTRYFLLSQTVCGCCQGVGEVVPQVWQDYRTFIEVLREAAGGSFNHRDEEAAIDQFWCNHGIDTNNPQYVSALPPMQESCLACGGKGYTEGVTPFETVRHLM